MSKEFIVETSARHVHVTQEHLEILFGKGAVLTKKKDLSQPGQYACEEKVTVVGPKEVTCRSFYPRTSPQRNAGRAFRYRCTFYRNCRTYQRKRRRCRFRSLQACRSMRRG